MNEWRLLADEAMVDALGHLKKGLNPTKSKLLPDQAAQARAEALKVITALTPLVLDGSGFQSLQKQVLAAVAEKEEGAG